MMDGNPQESEKSREVGYGKPPVEHQFKPGNCANPGGRPKGQSITARLRALLERGEINGQPIKDGKQVADMVAEAILRRALKGDIRHIQEILNRVEGKVANKHEVSGRDGGALVVSSPVLQRAADELDAWRTMMTERLMEAETREEYQRGIRGD